MAVDRHSPKGKFLAAMNRGFGRMHIGLYRLSGGRIGGTTAGVNVLLLTVTGRTTGKSRTAPVIYWERDGEYVVSASAAGTWVPAWYRNLQANQSCAVQVGRDRFPAVAHLADAAESRELWKVTQSLNKRFDSYVAKAPGEIPMVVLRRAEG